MDGPDAMSRVSRGGAGAAASDADPQTPAVAFASDVAAAATEAIVGSDTAMAMATASALRRRRRRRRREPVKATAATSAPFSPSGRRRRRRAAPGGMQIFIVWCCLYYSSWATTTITTTTAFSPGSGPGPGTSPRPWISGMMIRTGTGARARTPFGGEFARSRIKNDVPRLLGFGGRRRHHVAGREGNDGGLGSGGGAGFGCSLGDALSGGVGEPSGSLDAAAAAFDTAAPASSLVISKQQETGRRGRREKGRGRRRRRGRPADEGLSRFHRGMLPPSSSRQRFVTGRDPLFVSVRDCPTRRWLGMGRSGNALATSQVYVNGTVLDRSAASFDPLHDSWLDDDEGGEGEGNGGGGGRLTVELLAEVSVRRPGYVNVLPRRAGGPPRRGGREGSPVAAIAVAAAEGYFGDDGNDDDDDDDDVLWITDFSLTRGGGVTSVDAGTGSVGRLASALSWPNEVNSVPVARAISSPRDDGGPGRGGDDDDDFSPRGGGDCDCENALLVTDGFLVPGRDDGGVYVVRDPGLASEWKVCLAGGPGATGGEAGWFYHRAVWVDLTGDGRQSILTARARRPRILKTGTGGGGHHTAEAASERAIQAGHASGGGGGGGVGQLVWLERPRPHRYDEVTGTPLDADGTAFDPLGARNTPWKVRVLDEGPDVMFSVADLDPTDNSVEVIASQFFGRRLSLHSIERGEWPRVTFRRILDDRCGASFSAVLADLDRREQHGDGDRRQGGATSDNTGAGSAAPKVVDCGSTVATLEEGGAFSHVLLTSHECEFEDERLSAEPVTKNRHGQRMGDRRRRQGTWAAAATKIRMGNSQRPISSIDGGSLFAYRVPVGKGRWRSAIWHRSVIATGFRVRGQLGNMINPGAPGFCYTFYPTADGKENRYSRPLIGISGDCAEAAYILRPARGDQHKSEIAADHEITSNEWFQDPSTDYALMCEIESGATVGSLAVGYGDFCGAEGQRSGSAKVYVPSYEKDKVLVFALGDGDEEDETDAW